LRWKTRSPSAGICNKRIAENSLQGATAFLAYLDRTIANKTPVIVPCREAAVVATEVTGDFCVITLKVKEFATAEDSPTLNHEVRGNYIFKENRDSQGKSTTLLAG
jgi:hypothetical protein